MGEVDRVVKGKKKAGKSGSCMRKIVRKGMSLYRVAILVSQFTALDNNVVGRRKPVLMHMQPITFARMFVRFKRCTYDYKAKRRLTYSGDPSYSDQCSYLFAFTPQPQCNHKATFYWRNRGT